jgi:hypothetical protein
MEESKTPESPTSAGIHVQPHHTSNPTTASVPIRTITPQGTSTSTDTLQPTPIAATHTPRVSAHNFPWSKQSPLQCQVPFITPAQLTHQCIRYTIGQTRHNLQLHCAAKMWKWNDFGGGGENKCFFFCIPKILFGDHTRDPKTRAILTQHALQHVNTFKHYTPTLHPSPLPHLLAAHLPLDIQAYSDFISKSLKTGDRNEELMIGTAKHLLHQNNITFVIHHALQVTGSPETVNSYPD